MPARDFAVIASAVKQSPARLCAAVGIGRVAWLLAMTANRLIVRLSYRHAIALVVGIVRSAASPDAGHQGGNASQPCRKLRYGLRINR